MADLDQLTLVITASASGAQKAIDKLTSSLRGLEKALNIGSLNAFSARLGSLTKAANSMNTKGLNDLAKALNEVQKAGNKLTTFGQATNQMGKVSNQAKAMADKISRDWGVTAANNTKTLAMAIEDLYSAAGNDAQVGKALLVIEDLIKDYARVGRQADETRQKIREMVSASSLFIDSNTRKEWGKDFSSNRGVLGLENTTTDMTKGVDAEVFLGELRQQFGSIVPEVNNTTDALNWLVEYLRDGAQTTMTYSEAIKEGAISTEYLNDTIQTLAESVGASASGSIRELINEVQSYSQIMKDVKAQSDSLGKTGREAVPFEGVAQALTMLEGVQIPDMSNLLSLKDSISAIGGASGTRAGQAISDIATGLHALDGIEVRSLGPEMDALTSQLRAIGSGGVVNASKSLLPIAEGLKAIGQVGAVHVEGLADLASALSMFGRKSAQDAIVTIPQLATAFRGLIDTLSTAPNISQKVIDLANAMANLMGNMKSMPAATQNATKGLKLWQNHAQKAHKPTMNLASAIGKLYAKYWTIMRVAKWFGSSMKLASDLVEVQNVVDNTFGDMKDKMEDFAKTSVDTLGMSELTAKTIASRFQAMGTNMGVPDKAVKSTNEFLQAATKMGDGSGKAYANVAESMADISLNLTKLAGDMASFYNQDYSEVAKKLEAVFTGQTRPLRTFGLDLTQATLKEFALRNGLNANIKTMSQYEKMLLRYQYVMANTTAAHGDFTRTIGTWANQIKLAQERLIQLKKILGTIGINVFKPLVRHFNDAMNTIIHLAESTLNALGKIFGWKVEIADVGTLTDDTEDMADNLGDAAGNAKKMKDYLLGIDELNVFNPDDGKGGGGGGASGGAADATQPRVNWQETEKGYDSLYDTLYKLGKRIGEIEKEWLQGIDWDSIYDKAERFGKGLASFLNGYLADAELFYERGRFIANTINTIAHALKAFAEEFNGYQLGIDIGSWINGLTENLDWGTIQKAATEIAKDIAQTINGAIAKTNWKNVGKTIAEGLNTAIKFFLTLGKTIQWKRIGIAISDAINGVLKTLDFKGAGKALNTWAKGLLDVLITALEKTNWKQVGTSIGEFLAGIDIASIGAKIGKLLWEAINAGIRAYTGLLETAPIETALITLFTFPGLSNSITKSVSGLLTNSFKSIATDFNPKYLVMNIQDAMNAGLTSAESQGSVFKAWSTEINQFSSNLSTATKVVGGFIGVAAEFATIKASIYDLVTGTGDMTTSLIEMSAVTTAVGAALTLVLGFPAGVIATGIAGLVGGLVGLNKALDEIRENNVLTILTTTYDESAITVAKIAENFKTITDNIDSGLTKLHGKYMDLQSLRGDLEDVAGGFELVASTLQNGTAMTASAMDELIGDLENVQSAWEKYIDAHYDYLTQSVIADYQFAKSQGILTKEMEQDYLNRISNLQTAHDTESKELQGLMGDVEEAKKNLDIALNENISVSAINEAKHALQDATFALANFGYESGAIKDEYTDALTESIQKMSDSVNSVDFSNLDSASYEAFTSDLISQNDSIQTSYTNTWNDIQRNTNERIAEMGKDHEGYINEQAANHVEVLNRAFVNAMDSEMISLYDKFYEIIATGDYEAAQEYSENVITPFVDSIKDNYITASEGAQPFLEEATNQLLENAFTTVSDWSGNNSSRTVTVLKDGWIQVFWDVRDEAVGPVQKATQELIDSSMDVDTSGVSEKGHEVGQYYVEGAVKGIEDNAQNAQTASENLGEVMCAGAKKVLQINSPSKRAYDIGQYFDEGLSNGITENTSLVEAAVNEMMATLENVFTTATDVFKPDAFITSFNTIANSLTTMIGQMQTSIDQLDKNVKNMVNVLFNDVLPKAFTKTSTDFTKIMETTDKGITTFDEKVNKRLNTLFDETMPKKFEALSKNVTKLLTENEKSITGSLGTVEKAIGTTVDNVKTKMEALDKWFDEHILKKTKAEFWTQALSEIPAVFETTFTGVANAIATIMNRLIEQINKAMSVSWEGLTVDGKQVMGPGNAKLFEITPIPMFETGGFPKEDGLFYANHNEMVGRFTNGRTAVANNEQIVAGIREGVQEAMSDVVFNMLNPYLSDIAQSSRETANKDFTVALGDREIAMASNRGQSLVGMSIIS